MPVREFDQNQGMTYGVGFDSVSSKVRGDCVVRTDLEVPEGVGGQEVIFKLRQITSSLDLAKELNISASASLRAAFGNVSAKASYVSQQNINQFSIYLLAQVSVTNPLRRMRDVKLTDETWKLLEIEGEEQFRERCGDEFLSGITTGGEYLAILQITTKTEEEKQNVSASVVAKGAGGNWKVGAAFQSALETISREHEVEITSFQQGGNTTAIPDTVEEIIERATNFPQQVEGDKAFAYSAFFQEYYTLQLPDGKNPIDVENQKSVIEKLAGYYLSYSDTLNSIEYVLKNSDQFVDFDSEELNQKANEIRNTLNGLVQSASGCFNNYKSCKLPDDLSNPIVVLPSRKSIEVRDAIDTAEAAANIAAGYTESTKNAAKKVMDILSTIAPGSSGKTLADQARQEANNAGGFAILARREADKAVLAKDKTDEAADSARAALTSADEAEQAAEIAVRNSKEVYQIGYKPYWTGPTAVIVFVDKEGIIAFDIWDQLLSTITVCPDGGSVSIICPGETVISLEGTTKTERCKDLSGFLNAFRLTRSGEIPYWGFWVSIDTLPADINLIISFKSTKTGLIGSIELKPFIYNHPDPWSNIPTEIKSILYGREIKNR